MISLRDRIPLLVGAVLLSAPLIGCNAQGTEEHRLFHGRMHAAPGETLQIYACPSTPIEVSASAKGLKLSSPATESLVNLDEAESTEIVAGDFWNNGRCFIAIKSSTGLVNDSFEIHRMDSRDSGAEWTAINPEFAHGRVISSYRDAARWHEETLCYSETIDSPFLCSKRESATDQLQRLTVCNEKDECDETSMVLTGTDKAVNTTVSAARAFFFKNNGGLFERRRSYLVRDDSVVLLDFFDDGAELYFKARYTGDTGTTTGWLSSDDLSIPDPD